MAKYPFLINVRDTPPHWHDFEFATSGEAITKAKEIAANGDSLSFESTSGDLLHIEYPASAINNILVYKPK